MFSISWSSPDPNLEVPHVSASNDSLLLTVKGIQTSSSCPVCSKLSSRIHSQYTHKVQDLPISGKSVGLLILTKRWFCDQPDCHQVKIFTERYDWLASHGRRTEVLRKLVFSTSCLSAEKVARSAHIPVSHDTLLALIHHTDIESEVSPFRGS